MPRGYILDVLRSAAALSTAHAADVREELRSLRKKRSGKGELLTILNEFSTLASFLNDMVLNADGGPDDGGVGDDEQKAGGGAVAVEPFNLRRVFHTAAAAGAVGGAENDSASSSSSSSPLCSSALTGRHAEHLPSKLVDTPLPTASSVVLGNGALLHYIYDLLVEGRAEYRRQIGDLALVCRQWRDLSRSERFWRPIAKELFPRLGSGVNDETTTTSGAAAEDEAAAAAGGEGTSIVDPHDPEWHRKYVVQYGRCLTEHSIMMGPWHEGISLSFDLHDEQDGLRLFSSTGPIRFTGTTIPGITAMKLTGRRRRVTTPFSASSRDPGGNFATIEELFQEGDQPEYPVSLTVRVTARDERTGRMALLFSSSKSSKRWVEPLGVEMGVPEGTLLVNQGWNRVQLPSCQNGGGAGDLVMQMLTVFYVAPLEGQDATIDPADRLYSVLTLDCAFMLQCKTEDQESIGRFILQALKNSGDFHTRNFTITKDGKSNNKSSA